MSYLKVDSLYKRFSSYSNLVLENIFFEIRKGEIVSILGQSGGGKTTLLKSIAGLEIPDSGIVSLNNLILSDNNTFIEPESRDIVIVFQDYALFPHLKTFDNIAYGLRKGSREEKNKRVNEMLEVFELDHVKNKYPYQISGGQQQRLALARALILEPKVLLIDEPFTSLDWSLRRNISRSVNFILKDKGITVIMATHDKELALTLSDRILILENGKIVQFDKPIDVYQKPRNEYVAKCFGFVNSLDITPDIPKNYCLQKFKGENKCRVFIRPECFDIVEKSTKNSFSGVIKLIYFHGQYYEFQVEIDFIDGKTVSNKFLITLYWNFKLLYSYYIGKRLYFKPYDDCFCLIEKRT